MSSKSGSSSYTVPSEPIKFLFELTIFFILLVPSIVWAGVKNIIPAKQKSAKGHVIVITGAARGLGRELALQFHKLGAKIACVDVDEAGNIETAKLITEQNGIAKSYKVDVSNREQIKKMHESVQTDLGPVDMVINNAGLVWGHSYINPEKDQFITDLINVNLLGQFWMNREILPSMLKRNSGHIVAMSSLSSMDGVPGISSYTASKWGVNGSMECLDNELRRLNSAVVTSTVLPYFVETNPKVTEKLDLRFPEIPTKIACKLIINGILENRRIFSVPGHLYSTMAFARLLPDNMYRLFKKITFVNVLPDPKDQEILDTYQIR
ncbi:17-beta-hydroxysteroid dehydrogenase 13-like [Adelges cooleyi]|uniref:17-beta-hydroxysteroid dehydrogenase 13-like n=1 Tax=Adelges cooleyi TaxID=133065 RepID=UPI00217F7E74|nr:17-beta-hydroxysteroid dehydrogenase 13-like [Adelges cooleyi]